MVDKTHQSTDDDLALINGRAGADGAALGSGPGRLGVLFDTTNRGFGCGRLGWATAAAVGTVALTTRLGDVLERLVKLGRHCVGEVRQTKRVSVGR